MTTKTVKTVTVEKRGGFHDDSFFKDSWDNYEQAMKDVVCKYDPSKRNQSSVTRTTTTTKTTQNQQQQPKQDNSKAVTALDNTYRQIRTSNITKDESQAVSCVEEDTQYKMVVDAKDYKPDEINVKVTDDNVIIVEGKIEKKEGNKTSSQSFTRRFMLPGSIVDFTKISSALSKDGILKIIAPKKPSGMRPAIKNKNTSKKAISSSSSEETSSSSASPSPSPEKDQFAPVTAGLSVHQDDWSEFDDMVEKSQQEMERMMSRHTLNTVVATPAPVIMYGPPPKSMLAPSKGVTSNKEVIRKGDAVTEREEKRWQDNPAPGVKRQHHSVTEQTKLKGHDGSNIGHQERRKEESEASGGHEEILPDGTKRKVFTKSYETKQVFTSSSTDPKSK